MRSLLLVLAALASACATTPVPPPAPPAPVPAAAPRKVVRAPQAPAPLADYFKIVFARRASFSHDERLIAYLTNKGGRTDVWVQPVEGGAPRQLTQVKGFVESFEFSPAQDALALVADVGGDELMRLYLTDSTGREPTPLFPDDPPGSRVSFVRWSQDGKRFLYVSSRRDPQYLDLYEYELSTRRSTPLWEASGKLTLGAASRDLKTFALVETLSDADSNVYLLRRGEKSPVLLTPHQGEALHQPADFTPDGKSLLVLSDREGEFQRLYSLDLAKKQLTSVSDAAWDIDDAGFSTGGRYQFSVVNADGQAEATVTERKSKRPVALPAGAPGRLVPITTSRSDRFLAARLQSEVTPQSVWVVDLKEGTARALIEPLPESLRALEFTASRSVRVKSFDGREVPAFLYQPRTESKQLRPAVISVHGGPTAQSLRDFDLFAQYLLTKGYVVLVPNVRGSTGYGKSYTRLDNLDLGGGPLKDVVACKQWLSANAGVDPSRVTVMGGSYGGYMALAAATFTPREFAAHVDIFGVSDLKSLVESFPAYWASFATFIYKKFGDPKNPEHAQYQRDRSPLYFVDKVERPLLVVQGANDARVKKDQSDRMVTALRERKIPVDYLVIEGEGHGFSTNENRLLALGTVDRFLDKYIWGDTEVKVLP